MAYLLDTCVIIDLVRGNQEIISRLKSKSPGNVYISTITEFELRYGLAQNPELKSKSKEVVQAFLSDANILPFRSEESQLAARIRYELKRKGTPIGAYDILIAATAWTNDFILVTSNEKEFNRIEELRIENWR
ncbi:MAG: PIN domain-containing protein [Imperialibacter sp.]